MELNEVKEQLKQKAEKLARESQEAANRAARTLEEHRLKVKKEQEEKAAHIAVVEARHANKKEETRLADESKNREDTNTRLRLEFEENRKEAALLAEHKNAEEAKRYMTELEIAQERLDKEKRDQVSLEELRNKVEEEAEYVPNTLGEPDVGTDGSTPGSPVMSPHLRHILRM